MRLTNVTSFLSGFDRRTLSHVAIGLGLFNVFIIAVLRHISYRDPTSIFFQPSRAYERKYSLFRQHEAEQFAQAATTATHRVNGSQAAPRMCIGIPTVSRAGTTYLKETVGSLLQGLTAEERQEIHFIVLIAVTDPERHPAYRQPWLHNLVDDVLVYDLSPEDFKYVKDIESTTTDNRRKGIFDFEYVARACVATGASQIAMVEDDVLAMDGWYHRALQGIASAAYRSGDDGYLYLRLFYTEKFLGWNSEHLFSHIAWSLFTIGVVGLFLDRLRAFSPTVRKHLTNNWLFLICVVLLPDLIILYFAAGRITVMPLPTGINSMNQYGCCSQGSVYPPAKVLALADHLRKTKLGYIDTLTEQWADDNHMQRWALTPSVLQHVGMKSSKADDLNPSSGGSKPVAQELWNFAFELNDAKQLHREHLLHTTHVDNIVR